MEKQSIGYGNMCPEPLYAKVGLSRPIATVPTVPVQPQGFKSQSMKDSKWLVAFADRCTNETAAICGYAQGFDMFQSETDDGKDQICWLCHDKMMEMGDEF